MPSIARIFSSDRYRVFHAHRAPEKVVVTFDHWIAGRTGFPPAPSGTSLYERLGWSQLHLSSERNDWFLDAGADEAIDVLRDVSSRYRRVVTCGYSMGAHAALRLSGTLGAVRAVAVSPQFSVDPSIVPWEDRWMADRRALPFDRDDPARTSSPTCKAFVLYDPWHAQDRRHVEMWRALRPAWRFLPLPGADHPALLPFQDTHDLGRVIAGLISGGLRPPQVRTLYRERRRDSASYWAVLAGRAEGHPAVVREAIARCLALGDPKAELLFKLGLAACRAGDDRQGATLLSRAIELNPAPLPWWRLRLDEARQRLAAAN